MNNGADGVSVLVIGWRRPQSCRLVLRALLEAGVRDVFVAVDGPRPGSIEDRTKVEETRDAVESFSEKLQLSTSFSEANFGLRGAVVSAISWFFGARESGIVLEDDVIPTPAFLSFAEDNLHRFRHDQRVSQISASSHLPLECAEITQAYFSRFHHVWGFATWGDRWSDFADFISRPERISASELQISMPGLSPLFYQHWATRVNHELSGRSDTWASSWNAFNFLRGSLSLTPASSLARNVGIGGDATNSLRIPLLAGFPPSLGKSTNRVPEPPPEIKPSEKFDAYVADTQWATRRTFTRLVFASIEMVRRITLPSFRANRRRLSSGEFQGTVRYLTMLQVVSFRTVFGRWPSRFD